MTLVGSRLRELRRRLGIRRDVVDVRQGLHAAHMLERHCRARGSQQKSRNQSQNRLPAQPRNGKRDRGGSGRGKAGDERAGEHAEADAERPQPGAHAEPRASKERDGEHGERQRDAPVPHGSEATTAGLRAPAGSKQK